jgi:6-phosphogluconolactonase/glucosamine-6-phosphate isomerase/deaminase
MLDSASKSPSLGMTLGVADIMQSRRVLLLVSGAAKRSVLSRLWEERISPQFPASILALHRHCTVLCDTTSAGTEPGRTGC